MCCRIKLGSMTNEAQLHGSVTWHRSTLAQPFSAAHKALNHPLSQLASLVSKETDIHPQLLWSRIEFSVFHSAAVQTHPLEDPLRL
jgi:hypothetical protein